jgi:hypothetical protein
MTNDAEFIHVYFELNGMKYRTVDGIMVEGKDGLSWNRTGSLPVVLAAKRFFYIAQCSKEKKQLEQVVDECSKALQLFPKSTTGLTPDAVKSTPEFITAKANYQRAFAELRAFNASSSRA